MTMTAIEKKNKRKGMRNSLLLHALLLLIIFFYTFPKVPDHTDAKPPPVVVDFSYAPSSLSKYAHAEEGKKKPKTEKVVKIETTVPKPIPTPKVKVPVPVKTKRPDPEPTDPIVTDAVQEESPIEAVDEEIEIEEPEPEVLTEEDLAELEEEEEILKEAEVVMLPTKNSTSTDNSSDTSQDASVTEGEEGGTGKGNEGDGPGASTGDDGDEGVGDAGNGTGDYDDSGDGVFGRRVIKGSIKDMFKQGIQNTNGRIVMKFCVNPKGNVTWVELIESETTETNRKTIKAAIKAVYNYQVEEQFDSPEEQCGKYSFKLSVNTLIGD